MIASLGGLIFHHFCVVYIDAHCFPPRITEWAGVYGEGDFSFKNTWSYIVIINNISQGVNISCWYTGKQGLFKIGHF